MRYLIKYVLILLCSLMIQSSWAQIDTKSICRIEDGKIIFRINLKWNLEQRKDIANQFDIDSFVLAKVFDGSATFTVQNETWTVAKISSQIVEISKVLDEKPVSSVSKNNVILAFDNGSKIPSYVGPEFANYGVNKFESSSFFKYENGIAVFFLPNQKNAKRVYLSGSFNGWSTMQTPMIKSDSGWVVKVKLQPGMYYFKYIIDGKWTHDSNNDKKIRDGNWGFNSIAFCYNYQFKLIGYLKARRVMLAGSFNGWNPDELAMVKTSYGWNIPLFLREGTHAYKFIVDGNWITDPANKVTRNDGRGNINSFIGIGEEHIFKLSGYPSADKVFLAGNFNAWNNAELEMVRISGGWQLPYSLGAGNYEYKFVVSGKFITDPQNPYKIGSGEFTNSFLAFKANHIFTLNKFPDAKKVIITGSFNGWNRDSYRMVRKDGKWIFPLYLKPGKHSYKFIVDGEWIIDPDNKLWEENEFGTDNSVLWIEL
ncbi:MAG: glycogen-binding domain-containing protein [Tenuifilaceae bacterium]